MKHRIFIAIVPPENTIAEISKLQSQLEKLNLPVIWQPAEKIHLTLNFVGKVDESQLRAIEKRVFQIAQNNMSFELNPLFLETLYRKHEPSIIHLGLAGEGVQSLKDIQRQLSQELNELEFPQPNRYMPHISIGSLKRTDPIATKKFLDKISDFEFNPLSPFTVNSLTIFASFLSKTGSTFQRVGQYMLG